MPKAIGQKYHYQDHDTDIVDEDPPVQNQWYEVFHDVDVRLLWCDVVQTNDETDAKYVEVRWTIDGNVYLRARSLTQGSVYYVYRILVGSTGGTLGLDMTTLTRNAVLNVDKRGLDFKVEVRLTSVPGTNQTLICRCVRETLELT